MNHPLNTIPFVRGEFSCPVPRNSRDPGSLTLPIRYNIGVIPPLSAIPLQAFLLPTTSGVSAILQVDL